MNDAHTVERLWIRAEAGGPMLEQSELELVADQGVRGDHKFGKLRHVTLVFAGDWARAEAELGLRIDPAGRRANVFLTGGDGARLVGKTVRLGGATVEIKKITSPCPVMEQAAAGLEDALRPNGRGGVWGRILEGGKLVPGDTLTEV